MKLLICARERERERELGRGGWVSNNPDLKLGVEVEMGMRAWEAEIGAG